MSRDWEDFMKEMDAADAAEGPEAVAQSRLFRSVYELARRVLLARKEQRLSQQALAAASGIDQAEISRIEQGQSNPTMATLVRLLGALGLRLDYAPVAPARRRSASKRVTALRARRRARR